MCIAWQGSERENKLRTVQPIAGLAGSKRGVARNFETRSATGLAELPIVALPTVRGFIRFAGLQAHAVQPLKAQQLLDVPFEFWASSCFGVPGFLQMITRYCESTADCRQRKGTHFPGFATAPPKTLTTPLPDRKGRPRHKDLTEPRPKSI